VAVTHPPRALQVRVLPDALALTLSQHDEMGFGPVYRFRTPLSQSGKTGSIPVRAAVKGTQTQAKTHDQPRRGGCPTGSHKAGLPGSSPGPGTQGRGVLPFVSQNCQARSVPHHASVRGKNVPWSSGTTPLLQRGKGGSTPSGTTSRPYRKLAGFDAQAKRSSVRRDHRWAAGPMGRRLACNQEIGVQLPGRSTRRRLCRFETEGSRIRFAGPPC